MCRLVDSMKLVSSSVPIFPHASRSRFAAMAAPQLLTLEDCLVVAKRHFGRDDVQVSHWKEKSLGGDKPAGYLGAHKLVEVFASAGESEDCIHTFVKTIPGNENQASLIDETSAFRKEFTFYDKIVRAWEDSGIIPKESLTERCTELDTSQEPTWSCRCYLAREDLLVLENVALMGYKSDISRNVYDYDHALIALKMLATLHAGSLIYEEERSIGQEKPYRIGEQFPDMVQDTFYIIKKDHPGEKLAEAAVEGLTQCAKKLPICEEDSNTRRLVEERLPAVLRRMYDTVKASPRHRNVLCHADLWQNNILFREDAAGRPKDGVLVDFQLLRYAPPAHDVYDLLFLTTRRRLRERHEQSLLDEYYATLSAALRRRGLRAEDVLSREAFDASLEEQRFAGRLNAVYGLHFLLSSDEALGPVFSDPVEYARTLLEGDVRARLICSQFDRDDVYRERIQECLMELLEKDVLV